MQQGGRESYRETFGKVFPLGKRPPGNITAGIGSGKQGQVVFRGGNLAFQFRDEGGGAGLFYQRLLVGDL